MNIYLENEIILQKFPQIINRGVGALLDVGNQICILEVDASWFRK